MIIMTNESNDNCLSVFNHSVGLALQKLSSVNVFNVDPLALMLSRILTQ